MPIPTKIVLAEQDAPNHWYNINADLAKLGVEMVPPRHPATGEPIGPDDLAPLFPMALIEQEVSTERYIEIPEAVQDAYRLWRPTPLYRAHRWEEALDTPAHIYYKYEGVVVFSLSGHGHFDLSAYIDFKSGRLVDYEYPEEAIHESLAALPDME